VDCARFGGGAPHRHDRAPLERRKRPDSRVNKA
jgi:hypothetical protein